MPARELIKNWYRTGNPLLSSIATGLNRLGTWCNTFDAVRPIFADAVPGGVKLRWQPWESPFVHPWRVTLQPGAALLDVAGGRVHRGDNQATVTGLTGVGAVNGRRIWLTVTHYHDQATASAYALGHGTSTWPSSTNTATVATIVLPVAEIVGTTLYQYLYSDQFVPRPNPPLPDLVDTYALMTIAGVVQWVAVGECP